MSVRFDDGCESRVNTVSVQHKSGGGDGVTGEGRSDMVGGFGRR